MGFANNIVPGYIARDPAKLASLMQELGYDTPVKILEEPPLPGMEDYAVEDDTPDAQYMDELGRGNLTTTIYRIVNARGEVERSSTSSAFNKPYYSTLKGARSALTYLRRRANGTFRLQKGEVTWEEL